MKISTLAIKRPITTVMVFLGLGLLGIISWNQLPMQILPRMTFPEMTIRAYMNGYSPDAIERDIIIPLEGQISTLDNIEEISSRAEQNGGRIRISYHFGTDMKLAFLRLQQRVSAVEKSLPKGSNVRVNRADTEDLSNFLMILNLQGSADIEYLREFAERKIKSKLEQVDGVVAVYIGGGRDRAVEVDIDEYKCRSYNIPVSLIKQKLESANVRRQFLGSVTDKNRRYFVTLDGSFTDVLDIKNLVIDDKIPIFLKDIADIKKGYLERKSYYRVNGKQSIGLWVLKDDFSNLIQLSNNVLEIVDELNGIYEKDDIFLKVAFNQAEWMENAINKVKKLALVGIILAILVLLFFIKNIRIVIILMLAIPISLLITFFIMFRFGLSVNILSLIGLALAIGMLVDNGIVVLENIFRHYEEGNDSFNAANMGSHEVSRSVIAATFTTVIVFLPFLFVGEEIRIIGKELSLSVIFPLLVSLFVALTLIPMLASKILKRISQRSISGFKIASYKNRVLEVYTLVLKTCLRYPARTIGIVLLFFFFTIISTAPFILKSQEEELPDSFDVYVEMPKGSSLDAADAVVRQVEVIAADIEDKDEIRSSVREEEYSTVTVQLLEEDERKTKLSIGEIKRRLKRQVRGVSGGIVRFEKPASNFGGGRSGGSGGQDLFGLGTKPEKVIIRGYDLNKLESISNEIETRLEEIDEINTVSSDLQKGKPELHVMGNYDDLSSWNVTMQDVMSMINVSRREGQTIIDGFKESDYKIDIKLKMKNVEEKTVEELKDITIITSDKRYIPIEEVTDFRILDGPSGINRRNQEREVTVEYEFEDQVT
ncbi:MAG TPA: efflux RND transporter permease subunit, partial [bacterium]|nr:efflux RND transporter permease subunit [bacterium]